MISVYLESSKTGLQLLYRGKNDQKRKVHALEKELDYESQILQKTTKVRLRLQSLLIDYKKVGLRLQSLLIDYKRLQSRT
jgi:hypothetical protein